MTTFAGSRNIAIKVPAHEWEATVAFYRDVLGLASIDDHEGATGFVFGTNQLWIDRMPALSRSEVWLQVTTDDIGAARERLETAGIVHCDAVEPLGDGAASFWILSPAATVHLVTPTGHAW